MNKPLSPLWIPAMLGAFAVTIVVGLVIVLAIPNSVSQRIVLGGGQSKATLVRTPMVAAIIADASGGAEVTRALATPAFALGSGESLDGAIGPDFTTTITIDFDPGRAASATFGADLRGGQLVVRVNGREVLTDAAGDDARRTMSARPVTLGSGLVRVEYEFTRTSDAACAMRPLWKPEGAPVALPLDGPRGPLVADDAARGTILMQERQCVACHRASDPDVQERLAASPAPDLSAAGSRIRLDWLRRWIDAPESVMPGTAMPNMFAGGLMPRERVEQIAHYVASLGAPLEGGEIDQTLVATGRNLYHTIGCFACHGALASPREIPSAHAVDIGRMPNAVPLGDLATKTTVSALTAFLLDPHASRPSGLMPAMELTEIEARAIASYLLADGEVAPIEPFDQQMANEGGAYFVAAGCASCHVIDAPFGAGERPWNAPPLESIAANPEGGCLAPDPPAKAPHYDLDHWQRRELAAALAYWTGAPTNAPIDHLAIDMTRMRCVNCHAYGAAGPDASARPFFSTKGEADLGDEGRFPPSLTGAGARLTTAWMRGVLTEGERARPYMATRMPNYHPESVRHLPDLFPAAAGATPLIDEEPEFTTEYSVAGRTLVGSNGLNCIQCHQIAGRESTGTPGPDLALMPGRLRPDYFRRWLHDPIRISPSTRMPTFFIGGRSAVEDVLDGRASEQIDAMWCYLSQGEGLALPEGLPDPQGLELTVGSRPVVFRTFMEGAGSRAIACGFPEQVHAAFDADRCELALVWSGRFLNATGVWAGRGGTPTNPEGVRWTGGDTSTLAIAGAETARRFRGYRLDDAGRPTMLYLLEAGDTEVTVSETPAPRDGGFVRSFRLEGPAGTRIEIDPGSWTGTAGTVTLDASGIAMFDLELPDAS